MLGLFIRQKDVILLNIKIALFVGSCSDARWAKSSGVKTLEDIFYLYVFIALIMLKYGINDGYLKKNNQR